MPATMQSVTTRGYGNGTFAGTMPLVTTLGYGFGAGISPGHSVCGKANLTPRVTAIARLTPRVTATARVEVCEE